MELPSWDDSPDDDIFQHLNRKVPAEKSEKYRVVQDVNHGNRDIGGRQININSQFINTESRKVPSIIAETRQMNTNATQQKSPSDHIRSPITTERQQNADLFSCREFLLLASDSLSYLDDYLKRLIDHVRKESDIDETVSYTIFIFYLLTYCIDFDNYELISLSKWIYIV